MEILSILAALVILIVVQYLPIYLSYYLVSRKNAPQKQIHKTALVVAGGSLLAGIVSNFFLGSSSVAFPITAVMLYQMGCLMLQQTGRQAWASCGIYIGVMLSLIAIVVYLMVSNETFCTLMQQIAQD